MDCLPLVLQLVATLVLRVDRSVWLSQVTNTTCLWDGLNEPVFWASEFPLESLCWSHSWPIYMAHLHLINIHIVALSVGHVSISGVYGPITTKFGMRQPQYIHYSHFACHGTVIPTLLTRAPREGQGPSRTYYRSLVSGLKVVVSKNLQKPYICGQGGYNSWSDDAYHVDTLGNRWPWWVPLV